MEIAGFAIEWAIQTVFLTIALWVLVKLQKFQFTFLGLLGSAAVASVFDLIPLVGHYLAVTALFLCMMKATREDRFSLIFTVGVSYALTFGMNLFLLSSLMGDLNNLRVKARGRDAVPSTFQPFETDDLYMNDTVQTTNATSEKTAVDAKPLGASSASSQPEKPNGLELRGIINGPKAASVMISAGSKTYSLFPGDTVHAEIETGTQEIRLLKVIKNTAVLSVDGQEVRLSK
jgi:hypothetical protein